MSPMRAVPLLLVLSLTFLPAAQAASPSDDDARLATSVATRLSQPDASPTVHLNRVTADHGAVVLTGSVRTRYARAEAIRVAGQIPGVEHVDARLRIEPNP